MRAQHLIRWAVPVLAVATLGAARDVPLIDAVKKTDAAAVSGAAAEEGRRQRDRARWLDGTALGGAQGLR